MKNILLGGAMPRAIVGGMVRADASDPKALIGQLNAAFEEFKTDITVPKCRTFQKMSGNDSMFLFLKIFWETLKSRLTSGIAYRMILR